MTQHYKWIFTIVFSLLYFSACEIINPAEQIPAYLKIEPFDLTTRSFEGSNTSKITDAWVYVGGELLGAFPLPATIPVLQEGTKELVIDPGINENGIEALPQIYPFYRRYSKMINLVSNETININPTTKYKENLTFALIENFESDFHALKEDLDEDETTIVEFFKGEAASGIGSGRIVLTKENPLIIVASLARFENLPTDGSSQVYLEMDYKTDIILEVGLRGLNSSGFGVNSFTRGVRPNSEWNKVYMNLTEPLAESQLDAYKLAFKATFPSTDFSQSEAIILLDNLKIVYSKL